MYINYIIFYADIIIEPVICKMMQALDIRIYNLVYGNKSKTAGQNTQTGMILEMILAYIYGQGIFKADLII